MISASYKYSEVLVSTEWAIDHLEAPTVRFIEVDVDTIAYDSGHLPGALGWNWQAESSGYLPELLAHSGISNATTVVLYGDNPWVTTYTFWLLKLYGHQHVRLIDGGRQKLLDERRPFTTRVPRVAPTVYTLRHLHPHLRALRGHIRAHREHPTAVLVDGRVPAEAAAISSFRPDVANIPWIQAINTDGTFKGYDELFDLYLGNGITPDQDIIAYCGGGKCASHTWFVLSCLLGYPNVRNHDGAWTESERAVSVPILRLP